MFPWRKCLFGFFALWVIVTAAFVCLFRLPGDPARLILGPQASAQTVAEFRTRTGLDEPLLTQYRHYLGRLVRGDLGQSFAARRPVAELILERGAVTLRLALVAAAWVLVAGLLLPATALALRAPGFLRWAERLLQIPAMVPPYALATFGLLLFAGWLGWSPVNFDGKPAGWWLPALVLAAYPAALVCRLFSSRLEQEIAAPYARWAQAQGFSPGWIVWREAAPNALPAALAALANSLAYFVTGSFFIEVVFGLPGLGRLAQEALRNRDVTVLAGTCLAYAFVTLALSFILDAAQVALDPRSRAGGADHA